MAGGGGGCEHGAVSTLPTAASEPSLTPVDTAPSRSAADEAMRRLLRISDVQPRLGEEELRSAFSRSILVSAVRCILTYLVIPFLGPVIGVAAGVEPVVGIPIAVLAIVFNVKSIRRFWRADHRWRWAYTAVGAMVIALLLVLVVRDLVDLLT